MTIAVTMTVYDRPDLLKKTLESLLVVYPCGADVVRIYVDGEKDKKTTNKIKEVLDSYVDSEKVRYFIGEKNKGIACATNKSLAYADWFDTIIRMDSDVCVEKSNWCKDVDAFLKIHPEIGIVSPDLQGRYMRIHRPSYDEVEYALGMVWGFRNKVYKDVKDFHGKGFFDENIHHQFDPDTCLRARMLGYRIAVTPLGNVVHLGEGSGDSTRSTSTRKGGFEFLEKWNKHYLGMFHYKSPMFLRWDWFPLNFLWRKMWLSQFKMNELPRNANIQGHEFTMIEWPETPNRWMLHQTREAWGKDLKFNQDSVFDNIDPELLDGKREWRVTDEA